MKKTNNKGFSLVELIVVVAIMAVLMVVLAPQYLRYVEKSRAQKDESAIAEVENAIKIAMADETINKAVLNAGGGSLVIAGNATTNASTATPTELGKELALSIGQIELSSTTLAGKNITLTVTVDATTQQVTVTRTEADKTTTP